MLNPNVTYKKSHRSAILFILILAGEAIFFLPFILPRVFRASLLKVYDITNIELGSYFSIYGFTALVSYLFGGPLADKFPANRLMSSALFLTAIGGFVLWLWPTKLVMPYLYAYWGVSTILLFWAPLIRTTRFWGGEQLQARAFGWLEAGRGLTAALLGLASVLIFSLPQSEAANEFVSNERAGSYSRIMLVTSVFIALVALLVWIVLPNTINKQGDNYGQWYVKLLPNLFKMPTLWLLTVIIVCAYSGYKITDNFSLYVHDVLGFSEPQAAWVGSAALWVRALVALLIGGFADRFRVDKLIAVSFTLMVGTSLLVANGLFSQVALISLANFVFLLLGVYSVRSLYFVLIDKGKIPLILTGTAVGLVSVLGFTPDIYMGPWMGRLLDINPGELGHQKVFMLSASFGSIGLIASWWFGRLTSKG